MKILYLSLKKKWFDMILSGEKKEEYREIKPYWTNRISYGERYDAVKFVNGYGNNRPWMLIELKGWAINYGCPEWGGDTDYTQYVLYLGKILDKGNITSGK